MAELFIENARVIAPGEGVLEGSIHVRNGVIKALGPDLVLGGGKIECINARGKRVTPGLIDVHTHGMHHYNYDRGAEELRAAAALLPRYGVTTVIPTLVPKMTDEMWAVLPELAAAIPSITDVSIPGLHLEGPFVAIAGAACATLDGDLELLERLLKACSGRVSVMSIAPEKANIIPVIERLRAAGIAPFITHTRASAEQTWAAIEAGARHATHFYDVFPVPEETDPGVRPVGAVEAILVHPEATCDFICDGIHVHPMAVRAAIAAKGVEGVSLITDASFGAGLGPGVYDTPWGYNVEAKPGNAPRIADPEHPFFGALAGSALTMNQGMANLLKWIDKPEAEVWAMGTSSPARVLDLTDRGKLEPGMRADLVLWNDDEALTPAAVWVGGKKVF
ncbi:MAG: amidohydrolase family protein [Candidatus Hydrogenedentes bacterium]|nr:amidohydrolase family protein [Candidatus Hydrogenedentota bacterium]